jgi:hypothetical protein
MLAEIERGLQPLIFVDSNIPMHLIGALGSNGNPPADRKSRVPLYLRSSL